MWEVFTKSNAHLPPTMIKNQPMTYEYLWCLTPPTCHFAERTAGFLRATRRQGEKTMCCSGMVWILMSKHIFLEHANDLVPFVSMHFLLKTGIYRGMMIPNQATPPCLSLGSIIWKERKTLAEISLLSSSLLENSLGKSDAAHEPERSHVKRFCKTSYFNSHTGHATFETFKSFDSKATTSQNLP